MSKAPMFLMGVVEGFYGAPWSAAERAELLEWLHSRGLNTYLYAPKDDLKHRVAWRESYSVAEAAELKTLVDKCQAQGVEFVYALAPGLDIQYSRAEDAEAIDRRIRQLQDLGCTGFALLFDDIPDQLDAEDLRRWGSLAAAQAALTNRAYERTRTAAQGGHFLFCPTPYCGRMRERSLGGADYLETIGRELRLEIGVFWTGPEIISREITLTHLEEVASVLRRKPVIWDNLHANDYDGRRFFCGPYAGRAREMLTGVGGVLLNPNCELPLNYVALRTFAEFLHGQGTWQPREAYLRAAREWHGEFGVVGPELAVDDLVLFLDCYYLPHEEGPEAEELHDVAAALLDRRVRRADPEAHAARAERFLAQAGRLKEFCAGLARLRNRELFHALHRRAWELREELDLLERAISMNAAGCEWREARSDFHLPGTYRGGMVARLQRLFTQNADGSVVPAQDSGPL